MSFPSTNQSVCNPCSIFTFYWSILPQILKTKHQGQLPSTYYFWKPPLTHPPSDHIFPAWNFLAILVLLPIRTLLTYCSSCLRIEHGVSPKNTAKHQHTVDEALAHFLLSINRGNIHTHAQITPPSSPICHNEILMPLLLLGITYTCTSTLCYAQHASTHSGTPMHTHPPIHLTRGSEDSISVGRWV